MQINFYIYNYLNNYIYKFYFIYFSKQIYSDTPTEYLSI